MGDFSGIIIWIVIGIAISFFSKKKKLEQQKRQEQQQKSSNISTGNTTLNSQLTRAMNQINDLKNAATESGRQRQQNSYQSTAPKQQERRDEYRSSLEGHIMEGVQVEGYQMEGAKVEGFKVEGQQVEGIKRRHNTGKFIKGSHAVTESSMRPGFAGEGCDEHYDLELKSSVRAFRKSQKRTLYFSDNPILQGVVMSQILERPSKR